MNLTRAELAANFDSFTAAWKSELPNSISALDSFRNDFLKSYSRIASLNAWRGNVLEHRISGQSLEFFAEALNDALVSHVFARLGSWRSALMALRSCIENTCYCLYYADHPIEQRLWDSGRHRPAFSEIHTYLENHPDITGLGNTPINGLSSVKEEYGVLSRAVHASARTFRMSPGAHQIALWKADAISLGQWRTREQRTLCSLNLLLASMFRDLLSGTQLPGLRKALAIVIPLSMHGRVKRDLKIALPSP